MRILFIDLDTLRPDHLGCYGYGRNTSPNIDLIAKEGTVFEKYYCSDAPCLPSRAACFSGKFGIHNGVVNHGGICADMRTDGIKRQFKDQLAQSSLPAFLKSQGYHTATISPFAERHSSWTFYAGFKETYDTGSGGMESAEEISPIVLDWLNRHGAEDNWFLHVNYWDAHAPYRAPKEFGNPFEDMPLNSWIDQETINSHRKMAGPHTAQELSMYENTMSPEYPRQPGEIQDMTDFKKVIDGYDCGIKYMDDHIGMILNCLKLMGVYDETAVIVSSDHGENLGELGIYCEHATADEFTCHIPMIIKWPDGMKNNRDCGLHYNLDLLPSLAEAFHVADTSQYNWDGQSYAGAFLHGKSRGRDYLVISQCTHVVQRSVLFDSYLWIKTLHDGHHLFTREMLFNLDDDPHEQQDLSTEKKEIAFKAAYLYQTWLDDMMLSSANDTDPMWTVIQTGGPYHADGDLLAYCKRLEETGREDAAKSLKKHYKLLG